jgi:hypothetical protein
MSNAEKAREVLERGATRRGTWSPKADGMSRRIYKWWQARSNDVRSQENFCHYWRVVLIWAPLRWVAKPLLWLLALAAIVAAVWLTVVFSQAVLPTAGMILGIVLVSALSSTAFLSIADDEFKAVWNPWLKSRPAVIRWSIQAILWPFVMFWKGFLWILDRFIDLHEKYDLYGRVGRWLTEARVGESKWLSWIRPWLVFPLTLVTLAVWYVWIQVILGVLLGVSVLVGIVVLLAYVGEKYDDAKKERAERLAELQYIKVDETLRVIYEVTHPETANDDELYREWYWDYCDTCRRNRGVSVYRLSVEQHLLEMEVEADYMEACQRLGHTPHPQKWGERQCALGGVAIAVTAAPKEPSRWQKAWRGLRDGLRLIWAIVLTKKWGICPLVDVHDER